MPQLEQSALFDPFSARAHKDPYPDYAMLRAEYPVYHQPELDFWFVSRYDDVCIVLNDWETFTLELGEDIDDTASLAGHDGNLLENDPPRHRLLRRVVQAHWTPTRLAARLAETVDGEIARLVEEVRVADGARVDLGSRASCRLPVAVISEFMGIPESDRAELARLQVEMIEREPGAATLPACAIDAARRQRDYFAAQLQSRRETARDDLLSIIAEAEHARTIHPDESIGLVHQVFTAAIDTTASLIANMFMLLGTNLEQQHLIRADLSYVDRAIEEVLRFESPIQNAKRTTTRPITVGGTEIPANATVVPLFGSANRDETRFAVADTFNIRRAPQRNLAFGAGVHHCLGAPLARLEARRLLSTIVRELPPFQVVGQSTRFPSHVLRGYASVPLAFSDA